MNTLIHTVSSHFKRCISTSAVVHGKRNFRKFILYNKRGTRIYKREQADSALRHLPVQTRGVREVGYIDGEKFVMVPEMIPELIVPDLKGFELKPYVSYRAPEVYQTEYTAQDLFDAVYRTKIKEDFKQGKLDEQGNPLTPSPEETLTAEEATMNARKTGSDIF